MSGSTTKFMLGFLGVLALLLALSAPALAKAKAKDSSVRQFN